MLTLSAQYGDSEQPTVALSGLPNIRVLICEEELAANTEPTLKELSSISADATMVLLDDVGLRDPNAGASSQSEFIHRRQATPAKGVNSCVPCTVSSLRFRLPRRL